MAKKAQKLTININGQNTYYDWNTDTKYIASGTITPTTREDPFGSTTTSSGSSSGSTSVGSTSPSTLSISSSSSSGSGSSISGSSISLGTTLSPSGPSLGPTITPIIIPPVGINISDSSCYVYQERYTFGKNEVWHFGINSNNLPTTTSTTTEITLFGTTEYLVIRQKGKGTAYSAGTGMVDPRNLTDDAVKHNPLEKAVLYEAVSYLISKDSIRTVLVDIFAREKGAIRPENNKIEIHTVVLYKQPSTSTPATHDILLIDPSRVIFSSHFSNDDIKKDLSSITGFNRITISPEPLEIYKAPSKDKIGPGPNDYRNCVDIAVKLAFGFNELTEFVDPADLGKHPIVKAISNRSIIDEHFLGSKDVAFRIKQTSDVQKVKSVNKLEKIIDEGRKMLTSYNESTGEYFQTWLDKLLTSYDPTDPTKSGLAPLITLEKEILDFLKEIQDEQTVILGDVMGTP